MAEKLIFSEAPRSKKTLKVLAVGNSFSGDATTFIKDMALADNVDLRVANAYIAGCYLGRHLDNATNGTFDYTLTYYTPEETFLFPAVSLEQCLTASDWDIITIQQASNCSGKYETMKTSATGLVEYIKSIRPNAEIRLHMTWAYSKYYSKIQTNDYLSQDDMFNRIVDAYDQFSKDFNAKIIPSGLAMQIARKHPLVGDDVHRDGSHCSELGRVLTGWVWFECLTGISALDSKFKPQETKASYMENNIIIDDEVEAILRDAAHRAVEAYK